MQNNNILADELHVNQLNNTIFAWQLFSYRILIPITQINQLTKTWGIFC